MEFAGTARSWLIAFVLVFLAGVALVNLVYNLPGLQSQGETGTGVGLPSPLPEIRLSPETSLVVSVVLSVVAGGFFLAIYLKYRPKSGRFPLEELIPVLVILLLILSLGFLLAPLRESLETNQEENSGFDGGTNDGSGEDGGGALPFYFSIIVGPGVLGLLLVLFAFSAGLLLLSVLKGRSAPDAGFTFSEKAKAEAIRSLEETIYHLELGDDIRSAILICYRDLVQLFRDHGVVPFSHQTARELEVVALQRLGVSHSSSRSLRNLFEVARYSDHPLEEEDRREAIDALRGAKGELGE